MHTLHLLSSFDHLPPHIQRASKSKFTARGKTNVKPDESKSEQDDELFDTKVCFLQL